MTAQDIQLLTALADLEARGFYPWISKNPNDDGYYFGAHRKDYRDFVSCRGDSYMAALEEGLREIAALEAEAVPQ